MPGEIVRLYLAVGKIEENKINGDGGKQWQLTEKTKPGTRPWRSELWQREKVLERGTEKKRVFVFVFINYFHCSIAYELWSMVFYLFGIHWAMLYKVSELLASWQSKFSRHQNIDLLRFASHCLF